MTNLTATQKALLAKVTENGSAEVSGAAIRTARVLQIAGHVRFVAQRVHNGNICQTFVLR